MNTKNIISWLFRITIAIILIQTLYFKFTANPDSVYIFTQLGVEPYGRIGLGIVELITAILVLYPATKLIGILNAFGIICGAIFSHFLVIGTEIKGDGGGLLTLAFVVFGSCVVLLFLHKNEFLNLLKSIVKR